MKTILHLITLALLVLSPLHLCGQNFPPLDRGQSFSIHSSATGQDIGDTPAQIKQIMGTPTSETSTNTEGFGVQVRLLFGTSSVRFTEDFDDQDSDFWMYGVTINDQRMFMRVNGVDIYVGQLAEELAEHFPKSWANRVNDPIKPTSKLLNIEINETEIIFIVFNTAGIIETIGYSMRLT